MHAEQLSSKMVGSHDGALARCKTVDAFAHCFDDAAEFVAHCDGHLLARDRVLLFWDENGAGGVFMEVCDRVVNNRIFRFDYIVRSLSLTAAANSHVGWLHLEMGQIWLAYTTLCCHTFTSPFPQTGSSSFSTRISPLPWNRTAVAVIVY